MGAGNQRQEPTPPSCPLMSTYTHKINACNFLKEELELSTNTYRPASLTGCDVVSCLKRLLPRLLSHDDQYPSDCEPKQTLLSLNCFLSGVWMQQQAEYIMTTAREHCLHHVVVWVIPCFCVSSEHSRDKAIAWAWPV